MTICLYTFMSSDVLVPIILSKTICDFMEKAYKYNSKTITNIIKIIELPSLIVLEIGVSIVGSLRDREVACSASDRQGSNFESCVWRTVSSHHPQEVLLAQFSLYVH